MLIFTRADFNALINFSDIRLGEFSLYIDGKLIPNRELASRFASNTDIVLDRVNFERVCERLKSANSFLLEIQKPYPFHEILIRPTVELSNRHQYCYEPMLFAGKDALIDLPPLTVKFPIYVGIFESTSPDCELPLHELVPIENLDYLQLPGMTLGVIFSPAPNLHAEVSNRLMRHRLRHSDSLNTSQVKRQSKNENKAADEEFLEALKSIWPCAAAGRLPNYIYLREGEKNILGFDIDVNIGGGESQDRLAKLYEERKISDDVVVSKAPNGAPPRSPCTDVLAIKGSIAYRKGEWSESAGWPIYVSEEDPSVTVRSNGIVRWLRLEHGLFESIERLSDGRNLALGARTSFEMYSHLIRDRHALFGGLGLGVIQRQFALDSDSLTCETNRGVISAFKYLYPECDERINILNADIFEYAIQSNGGIKYSVVFLDFYDAQERYFDTFHLSNLLCVADHVIINRHIKSTEDLAWCISKLTCLPFQFEHHIAGGKQLIVKVTP